MKSIFFIYSKNYLKLINFIINIINKVNSLNNNYE